MKRKFQILLAALLALGLVGMNSARPTYAATNVVTNCSGDLNLPGSLTHAVYYAAAGDTITFNLDCSGANAITIGSGLPYLPVAKTLTIDGTGHSVEIHGGTAQYIFSVDGNQQTSGPFTVKGLTLSQSRQAIHNASGTVNVINSTIANNTTPFAGAAIDNYTTGNTATLTVTDSTISGNSASSAGAIRNLSGTVTIDNSTLSNNSATNNNGGAIWTSFGHLTVTNSTISGNSAPISGDGGAEVGGAIYNSNTIVSITNSTLSDNSALGTGGAIYNTGGQMTITTSTLSNNSVSSLGGAIFNNNTPLYIINSTFASNSAGGYGGVLYSAGSAPIEIISSTLGSNSASGMGETGGGGGVIYDRSTYIHVYIGGSILAGSGDACLLAGASPIDLGYNLESPGTGNTDPCRFMYTEYGVTKTNHDIIGSDPMLGPLADNGGPTQTMALQTSPAKSPAIDVIPAGTSTTDGVHPHTLCPTSDTTMTDQRGTEYARPDDGEGNCDIGAYEYQDSVGQSISFTGPSQTEYVYGDNPFTVSATGGSSGNPVMFTIATASQSVCGAGGANGATISILASGTCTVLANQHGSTGYTAASQTSQDFTIDKKPLTVTASHDAISYGDSTPANFTIGYSAWVGSDSATSGAISGAPACSVPSYAGGNAPGNYDITCTAGDLAANSYTFTDGTGTPLPGQGSTPVALGSLTVGKQTTSIDAISGSGTYAGAATVVAALKDAAGHGLAGKTVSFSVNGTAVCGGSTGVTCPTTADGTNGTTTGQATLTGVSLSGIGAGAHNGWVSASFAYDTNYADSTGNGNLNVGKASATLGLSTLSQTYNGTAKSVTVITTPSGLSGVSVTYTGNGTTSYGPSASAPTNAGSYSVVAALTNDNYSASDATGTLTIAAASQSVSFTLPAGFSKTYGNSSFSVASYASATSGLAVTFGSTTSTICTVSGSNVTILAVGNCTITASQPGDGNYTAAQTVSQSFSIAKAGTTTTVTSSATPSILKQGVTVTVAVTSGAGTPGGSVTIKDGATTLVSSITLGAAGTATVTTTSLIAGTHSITASYSGNSNYLGGTSAALSQQVRYTVKVLSTSALTIALQLQDFNGTNVSASRLTVTAQCVVPYSQTPPTGCGTPIQTVGKAFGFVSNYKGIGPAYSYSVNSRGLTKGQQYDLLVQTDGDPIWHAVPFTA